jgi:hypothetical protein
MAEAQIRLPAWILVVSGLIAIVEILASVTLSFSPETVLETVDLTAKGVYYLIYMWAARQFALGVIFGVATVKKSVPMLTLSYIFFLVMFVGDFFVGLSQNQNSLVITALVMCLVSTAMIVAVNGRK